MYQRYTSIGRVSIALTILSVQTQVENLARSIGAVDDSQPSGFVVKSDADDSVADGVPNHLAGTHVLRKTV